MISKKFALHGLAIAALVVSATASQAAITVFTTPSSFASASALPGVDTYTGFRVTGSTASPITRNAGVYSYTATVIDPVLGTPFSSFFGAGTPDNPSLSTSLSTDGILFNGFTGGVRAIAGNFFGSDLTGAFLAGNVTLTVVDSLGATTTQTITNATTTSFLGFVSNGLITSMTVSTAQTPVSVWPTVDNLTLAVPEPGTYALMLAGLAAVGAIARRRKA